VGALTDAERQQRKRDRLKAGLVRIEVWVPNYAEATVRAAIDWAIGDAEKTERKRGEDD
jgi:hypothetical protein